MPPFPHKTPTKVEFFYSSSSVLQFPKKSNVYAKNKSKSEQNTSFKDIYKKYSKNFQDPTRDLLDPIVEFVR